MSKSLKTILIIIVVVAVVGVIVFFLVDSKSLGSLIAVITGGWASFKAKLFSSSGKTEQDIVKEHEETRQNWDTLKAEYDSNINALKARMDYIDYRSAKISAQINDLKQEEKAKIEAFNQMTDKEKEDFVNNLLNP